MFHYCSNSEVKKSKLGPGAVVQVIKVLALHARDPIWVPVLIPAAPLPFQLPACGPGKQSRRPGRGSWLPIGIASARCAHLGSESSERYSSLSLLSVYLPFQ